MTTTSIISVANSSGSEIQSKVNNAASGTLLQSAGTSSAFGWTTSTYPSTNAANTLLYASSANVMAALATGNNGVLITSGAGVPSISSTLPDAVIANIPGNVTVFTTTLTNAQIKSIHTTPVTLVSAPAAGKVLIPLQLILKFNYGGNNAFVTGGNITLVTSTSGYVLGNINAGIYTGTTDKVYSIDPCGNVGAGSLTMEAQALQITTATLDPTGNAANDNTISVWLSYQTLTIV